MLIMRLATWLLCAFLVCEIDSCLARPADAFPKPPTIPKIPDPSELPPLPMARDSPQLDSDSNARQKPQSAGPLGKLLQNAPPPPAELPGPLGEIFRNGPPIPPKLPGPLGRLFEGLPSAGIKASGGDVDGTKPAETASKAKN